MAYRAGYFHPYGKEHMYKMKPSEPFCTNCNSPGHWITECWLKGGGAKNKDPCKKWKFKRKKNKNDNKRKKGMNKANQTIQDNDGDLSDTMSHASYMATSTTRSTGSCSQWVIDSGVTTHICNLKYLV